MSSLLPQDNGFNLAPQDRYIIIHSIVSLGLLMASRLSPHSGDDSMVCRAHEEWGLHFEKLHPRLPPLLVADGNGLPMAAGADNDNGDNAGGSSPLPQTLDLDPDRPLVVGYVSPDFFTHSVSYFAEAPLALHR